MNWMEAARAVVKGLFWVFEGARMSRHIITLFIVGDYMCRKSPPLPGICCLSISTPCFDTLLVERAPVHVLAPCRFGRFGSSSWPSLASSPRSGCSVFTTDISVVIYYRICSPPGHKVESRHQQIFKIIAVQYIAPENKSFPCAIHFFNQFPGFRSHTIARR